MEELKACLLVILIAMTYGFLFIWILLHKIEEHVEKIKKLLMEAEKEKKP